MSQDANAFNSAVFLLLDHLDAMERERKARYAKNSLEWLFSDAMWSPELKKQVGRRMWRDNWTLPPGTLSECLEIIASVRR